MLIVKFIRRRSGLVFLILALIPLVIYLIYLNPQARAARHLAAAHEAVTEMHPAILDKSASAFHAWHSIAYERAKELLPRVHSIADENALLNFYFAGYEDAHVNGHVSRSPFTWMDISSPRWAGWLTKATLNDFEVVMSAGGDDYPPVGAHLLSCNQQPIDFFLKTNIAPYIDKRWNLLAAKDRSAEFLSVDTSYAHLLNRPNVSSCEFEIPSGSIKSFVFRWSAFGAEDETQSMKIRYPSYGYPSVRKFAPKSYWVNVSDFKLNSTEAYQHHQQLLKDLQALKDVDLIVFDTRMNNGGHSPFGDEIIKSSLGEKNLDYLQRQLVEKEPGQDAVFRASWKFYWSYDFIYKQQQIRQGDNSTELKFFDVILSRLKQALDNHQETFLQSELGFEQFEHLAAENAVQWQHKGKVVLLTSRNCFSSCLNFVDTLKQVPGLIHMGEPTNGDTIYTQVAITSSSYLKEDYLITVPIKAYKKRWRGDNQAYVPDVIYEGNIYTDPLQDWVLDQLKHQ